MDTRKKIEEKDIALLRELQENFPIAKNPFRIIGNKINITEDEVITRLKNLTEAGIIRSIRPFYNNAELKRFTTLVCAKIPPEKIKTFTQIINSYNEVTHNYQRDNEYNIWFTLNCDSYESAERIIGNIKEKTGIEKLQVLPALKTYKIKVKFDL